MPDNPERAMPLDAASSMKKERRLGFMYALLAEALLGFAALVAWSLGENPPFTIPNVCAVSIMFAALAAGMLVISDVFSK